MEQPAIGKRSMTPPSRNTRIQRLMPAPRVSKLPQIRLRGTFRKLDASDVSGVVQMPIPIGVSGRAQLNLGRRPTGVLRGSG